MAWLMFSLEPDEGYILPETGSLNEFVNQPGVFGVLVPL